MWEFEWLLPLHWDLYIQDPPVYPSKLRQENTTLPLAQGSCECLFTFLASFLSFFCIPCLFEREHRSVYSVLFLLLSSQQERYPGFPFILFNLSLTMSPLLFWWDRSVERWPIWTPWTKFIIWEIPYLPRSPSKCSLLSDWFLLFKLYTMSSLTDFIFPFAIGAVGQ